MARVVVGLLMLLALTHIASADEVGRVRAHLRRAMVGLGERDVSELSPAQRTNRMRAIQLLERYIERGMFPRRTADLYPGLRPRFIDDRRVHCAVGQMLADSGESQLAHEINARYEYAYVADIKVPALLDWAELHGFTVDELAMIQPAYAPPEGKAPKVISVMTAIEHPSLISACLGKTALPKHVELSLVEDGKGARIQADSQDDFSRCFAEQVSKLPAAKHFDGPETVWIPTLDELLKQQIATSDCTPRPGALPDEVTINLGRTIQVATNPENAEIDACLTAYLQDRLPTAADYASTMTVQVPPRVTSNAVTKALLEHGLRHVTGCYTGKPSTVTLKATAHRGDEHFAIQVDGASAQVVSCVARKLRPKLRELYSVRRTARGKPERYFRADSDVVATFSFGIGPTRP
jgi:hypothetical protein